MKIIATNHAPQAIGPYSQAILQDRMLYTSGQIPLDAEGNFINGDIRTQTKQVLKNLSAVLKEAGTNPGNVIKTTVFLANMEDFAAFNEVYAEFFGAHKPARSTIAVKTLPKNALVEIECIAKID
ncbi:RidA family protein [Helicobacter mustelae]|uniref:Putative regulatory protein Endoribonuclease L-PSP n=1 Tax=Helicobacter mustelae (strain ATCC 43772 / CCUG 25715 / CIP 103759 / LMG 18044 / NCTC 12198 / R85-136P) TaxID=679897 RepID=D3UHH4_HELM1|nr:RidA family protein [Helicobacter mustelae]CBG39946.1 putative regulatory protein Endoribonuclease L-PSP [Helicobacter mustelae 12198]SQH71457.1 regulatory protein endoribonuclease L-PSP [Helicobacter mustelae]STP12585.1 regulatory protein endoribonuclease L-PSP [Helicobacter mustelae]